MTQTATAMFALPVSVFIRIHRRFCARSDAKQPGIPIEASR